MFHAYARYRLEIGAPHPNFEAAIASFESTWWPLDRKSTRLNSSHMSISYAVFCLKKKMEIFSRSVLFITLSSLTILVQNLKNLLRLSKEKSSNFNYGKRMSILLYSSLY